MAEVTFNEPAGFNNLTKADQIRYVQMLWDKIAASPNDVAIPDSHWVELQDRLAEYRAHPDKTQSARDVFERLESKSKR